MRAHGNVGTQSNLNVLNLAGISPTQGSVTCRTRLIDYLLYVVRPDVAVTIERLSASTHGSDHFGLYSAVVLK